MITMIPSYFTGDGFADGGFDHTAGFAALDHPRGEAQHHPTGELRLVVFFAVIFIALAAHMPAPRPDPAFDLHGDEQGGPGQIKAPLALVMEGKLALRFRQTGKL